MSAETDGLIAHLRGDLTEAAKPGRPQFIFPDSWASLDALAAALEAAVTEGEIAVANFEESARQFYDERERAEDAEAQRDTLAEAAAGVIAAKDAYMGASETGWRSWDSPSCAPQQQRYTKAVKALEAALAGAAPPEAET